MRVMIAAQADQAATAVAVAVAAAVEGVARL